MKLLCIGGTGLLSSAVVNEAISQGIEVTILTRGKRANRFVDRVLCITVDFYDEEKVKLLLQNKFFDAIIDFISISKDQIIYSYNLLYKYTKQFVYISSCAVYNTDIVGLKKENSEKIQPLWNYSKDKYDSECYIIEASKKTLCNYTLIRPSVTYGDIRIPYGVMPRYGTHGSLIQRIMNDKPVITWNQGRNKTNILHSDDFSKGIVGILGKSEAYNEVFNICGDAAYSWNDVLDVLEKKLNKKIIRFDIPIEFYGKESDDPGEIIGGRGHDSICSNEKIKKVVKDFSEKVDLYSGIGRTVDYYIENNWCDGIDYSYDGDSDRIIKKYCKINKTRTLPSNLHYIDYLNEKKNRDYINYFFAMHADSFFIDLLHKVIKIIKKCMNKLLG